MPSHQRSRTGKNKRYSRFLSYLERHQHYDTIRAEVKAHSRRDPASGEKAFHPDDRQKITNLLLESGCYIEKQRNIFSQTINNLTRHVQVRSEVEWQNFDPDTVNTVIGWFEDGQVLNRPT
ncbi:MAG: hypothetical protein LBE70_04540 [Nitrososphaerota archaeon]|nr:hypothetical protein [Nitrososphaerota archaeon]